MSKARRFRSGGRPAPTPEEEAEGEASRAENEAEADALVADLLGDAEDLPSDWRMVVEERLSDLLAVGREKGKEDRKTLDEVFDKSTLLTLWKFISNGVLHTLDYPVSTGKEANVFHATGRDGEPIAVKIFRTNTATFRAHLTYIHGDPRFGKVGRDLRDVVYVWAQKEYKNLQRYFEAGVRVPRPIAHRQNVLVMEFIGDAGSPAPLLKDAPPEDPAEAYEVLVADYAKGVAADLVHGDLSEYNVLNRGGDLYVIDVAQAVLSRHPMARELLERDARNLARYFRKLGVDTSLEETLARLKPREDRLKGEDGLPEGEKR